jgi:hypothetical protein
LKGGSISSNKSNGNSCSDYLNNFASCSRRSEPALQSLQFVPQNAADSSSENSEAFCFADLSMFFWQSLQTLLTSSHIGQSVKKPLPLLENYLMR